MSDLAQRMAEARGQVQAEWSEARAERNQRALQRRLRRRHLRSGGLVAAVVAAVLLLGLATGRTWRHAGRPPGPALTRAAPGLPGRDGPPPPGVVGPGEAARPGAEGPSLRFRDGSLATLLTSQSQLLALEEAPGRTLVQLAEGGARFDVVHDPARVFRVDARDAAIEVLGTQFTVERLGERGAAGAGGRVRVAVEHGRVRVLWDGGYAELVDGQSDVFPRAPDPGAALEPPPDPLPPRRHGAADATRGPALRPADAQRAHRAEWKALAQEGEFEQAYNTLAQGPLSEISDQPGDLLILADVARLSRHPAQAVAPLRKVVRDHPGDPRAPLSAFTLGRVLLDDLGRPEEAAEAFQQAQALDPTGPMAQDAQAREVEAWSRAGDAPRARERAEDYVRRYPDGRRLRSVRRYGGLE